MNRFAHRRIACCCAATLTIAAASKDTASRSIEMPLTDFHLLQTATVLAASNPDAAALGKALDVTLTLDAHASTRFFTFYKASAKVTDAVETIEVRTPVSSGATERARGELNEKGPLIILTLRPRTTLTGRQVMAQFGVPDELRVPPPQAASTGAVIYVYKLKKPHGEMRFALGPPPTESVLSVVIDRIE